jgi:hypothetical protein
LPIANCRFPFAQFSFHPRNSVLQLGNRQLAIGND